MARKTNKDKDVKDPILAEIENDDTPIDDKGNPVVVPQAPSVEDLLAKDPSALTAADMDILSQNKDDLTDEQKVAVGLMDGDSLEPEVEPEEEEEEEEEPVAPIVPEEEDTPEETPEEKDKRYKSQQTEAQIQIERNKAVKEKAEQAKNLPEPTTEELRAFVSQDGADWDELTTFEQTMAKKTYLSEKRSSLVLEAIQDGQKVDEWAGRVDEFIDLTDGKPEFVALSSHEAEFRKYAMKENHRGADIQMLLNSFLYTLPATEKKRGSLFNRGGGGEKVERKEGITDADTAGKLRSSNPREYARQVKAGKIKLEI